MFFPFHDDNPTERTPVVTCALIAVNLIVFLLIWRLPPIDREEMACRRGFVPARVRQLTDPNPKDIEIPIGPRRVWRRARGRIMMHQKVVTLRPVPKQIVLSLLTCMFLHGGWMHLIGNMWFLWLFGNNVEDRLGGLPFLLLYLGGGLLASGCHWAVGPNSTLPVIGASGAVATVLGAYAITWPWARVHTLLFLFVFITIIDLPALLVLGAWFAGQLLAGRDALHQVGAGGVAWWAHVGGFVAGLILMPIFAAAVGTRRRKRTSRARISDFR